MTEHATSAVRDAADLIFAAEELLDLATGDDLATVASAVDRIARAAKALRPGHLDDALAHVAARAMFVAQERQRYQAVKSWTETALDDLDDRHAAAVDALVGTPDSPDVEALRERVRGDDG